MSVFLIIMNTLGEILIRIIKEQELIVGPLAWGEARKVAGLSVDQAHNSVSLSGDEKEVVNRFISTFTSVSMKAAERFEHLTIQFLSPKTDRNENPKLE